ncbi:Uncharacterised protein [Mycobacterium tuberculosis]|nr:Uncharacterised protein [Mycobacterium tuberculosis]
MPTGSSTLRVSATLLSWRKSAKVAASASANEADESIPQPAP